MTMSRFDDCLVRDAKSCDLTELVFIDAFGLVSIASSILAAHKTAHLPVVSPPAAAQMREHLSRMGMLAFLDELGQPFEARAPPSDRGDVVVALTRLTSVFEAEQLSHLLWADARRWDAQVLETLSEALWELVANAIEHSGADALLMGQVYERGEPPDHDGRVQIVIGDAGRGIRRSFLEGGAHAPADDADAIELALQYLVSSVPDPGRGQGLTTVVELVTGLRGKVIVRSGDARFTVEDGRSQPERVERMDITVVGVSLPLYPGSA